jgi:hypothetical protein
MQSIEKAEDKVIDFALVGALVGGGFLLWKFLPELTETADLVDKIGDKAGKVVDEAGDIASQSLDVISDAFSGDTGKATQELYKVPVVGKIAVGVDKFFGSYRPPPDPSYETLVREDPTTYIPRLGELDKFNDWRPEEIQKVADKWIRNGNLGNLFQIISAHHNHLAVGVLNGQGSIARIQMKDWKTDGITVGNAFRIGTITKDQILVNMSEYGYTDFTIGFAWYLEQALGENWKMWSNREQMVNILNRVNFWSGYTIASSLGGQPDSITMGELHLLETYKIDVKAVGKHLVFSLRDPSLWAY